MQLVATGLTDRRGPSAAWPRARFPRRVARPPSGPARISFGTPRVTRSARAVSCGNKLLEQPFPLKVVIVIANTTWDGSVLIFRDTADPHGANWTALGGSLLKRSAIHPCDDHSVNRHA
jgi:hypothetical protein